MAQNNTNELYHHGILGQKWGVRRYQNKDGSLTPAGRKRAAKMEAEYIKLTGKKPFHSSKSSTQNKPTTIKEMSDDEIKNKINRMRLEQDYIRNKMELSRLQPEKVSLGKRIVKSTFNDVVAPATKEAGKKFLTNYLNKLSDEYLGLNQPKAKTAYDMMKDELNTLNLKSDLAEAKIRFNNIKNGKPVDESKELQKLAQDYENRLKIDKGQKEFKEGKYATKVETKKEQPKQETKQNQPKQETKKEKTINEDINKHLQENSKEIQKQIEKDKETVNKIANQVNDKTYRKSGLSEEEIRKLMKRFNS